MGKPLKVFISGPMSGFEDYNKSAFYTMERTLQSLGYSVFNPAWMLFDDTWTHKNIMPIDLAALYQCDAVVMLKGWENSTGAKMEYTYAKGIGKIVMEESDIYGQNTKEIR